MPVDAAWTPSPASPEDAAPIQASPEAIAACMANPAAMAALDAGDAAAFARALGVAEPSEEYLAAAATRPDLFPRQAFGNQPRGGQTAAERPGGDSGDDAPIIRMVRDGSGSSSVG
jgi:hypothetical protein